MALKAFIALTLLLLAPASYAVKFHSYINEQGETVFSNVPRKCIKNSTLTCLEYHPAMSGGSPEKRSSGSQNSTKNQPVTKAGRPLNSTTNGTSNIQQPRQKAIEQKLDILDSIVEMNDIINEYYPGKPDPAEASRVRQQQEDILDVLQVIKSSADSEEKTSIEKAMDILRSNLVE